LGEKSLLREKHQDSDRKEEKETNMYLLMTDALPDSLGHIGPT
jgi:hypothetical protein